MNVVPARKINISYNSLKKSITRASD